jgi:DNA ligase (NAD+)
VYQFFAREENRHTIERLRAANVRLGEPLPTGATSASRQILAGKVFVLTGTLPHLTRDQARDLISAAGGRVTSSVSRKTDYVLAGTEPGSKYDQAQRLGVPIIDEEQLYELLQTAKPATNSKE